jgi:hypothetical protein
MCIAPKMKGSWNPVWLQRYKHEKFGVGCPVLKEVTACNVVNDMAESPTQEMVRSNNQNGQVETISKDQRQVKNVHWVCTQEPHTHICLT